MLVTLREQKIYGMRKMVNFKLRKEIKITKLQLQIETKRWIQTGFQVKT